MTSIYCSALISPTVSPEGGVVAFPAMADTFVSGNQTFTCNAQGGPGNTFTWTRGLDNATVGTTPTLNVIVEGAEDGGVYTCEVSNSAGTDSATVLVNGENLTKYAYSPCILSHTFSYSHAHSVHGVH